MKKTMISIAAGVIMFLAGMGIDLVGYKFDKHMPLSIKTSGGEVTVEHGFGLQAAHVYTMSPDGHDTFFIAFDPLSFIVCLSVCIVLCIVIGRVFFL